MRVAFIVSHPIQYYAPLHRWLARRADLQIRVFFTFHGGEKAQRDKGFGKDIAWDIPLTEGYDFEVVPNGARNPGTHHFWGLRNPLLVESLLAWKPDVVHVTGYAYASHLQTLRSLHRQQVPVLFRGDSHLLDERQHGWRWQLKRTLLRAIFKWPKAFLCVGRANKDYYRAFGVSESRLFDCPHSIETERFAEPDGELEQAAKAWRRELGVREQQKVVLFAGKFEDKKRPVPLMRAFLECELQEAILFMVGDGEHGVAVRELAGQHPERFRVLPFQNQSKMPVVYRLGDLLVLPSSHGETWGLAVNEALACGRPALVSDRVGCHPDVVRPGVNGDVFAAQNWQDFQRKLSDLLCVDWVARRKEIKVWAKNWTIEKTGDTLVAALARL
ncbi:MAG TPA: glycosyltransferase family 4 protein [Verrucomicrobiae bacterium]|nr:glycosyltransferase family 4 protein [Verrucomicrobiae bacterium]